MNRHGQRIGEPASRWRMQIVPIATVMIASALPLMLPLVASSPVLPPLGLLFFLSWQLLRTEMMICGRTRPSICPAGACGKVINTASA